MTEPRVLYEDEELIAVNKPAGIATAAGSGIEDDASLHAWVTRHAGARTFIVHRLDRGTSGVMVFARKAEAHRSLSQAFEARQVAKRYLALVEGHMRRTTGEITEPLSTFGSGRVGAEGYAKISDPRQIEPATFVEIMSLLAISASLRYVRCNK